MHASDCIFCKMVAGTIVPKTLFADDDVLAFADVNPQAPVHFLVIPKRHIATLNDLRSEDEALVGRMYLAAQLVARQQGCNQSGYRTVMNCLGDAGQSVFHIHLHVLGGQAMGWPPFPVP